MKEQLDSIVVIPMDSIDPDPRQPRGVQGKQHINDLIEDIKEHGQLIPIMVTPYKKEGNTLLLGTKAVSSKDVRYWLIDGERRWRAMQTLGFKEVRASVKLDIDFASLLEYQFVTNTKRVQLTLSEMSEAIERYIVEAKKADPTITDSEIEKKVTRLTGYSYSYVQSARLITSASKELQYHIKKTGLIGDHLPAEIRGAVGRGMEEDAQAIRKGIEMAYIAEAERGKKHSVLDIRAVKTNLRELLHDTTVSVGDKERIAGRIMQSFWKRNSDEMDEHSDYQLYISEIRRFKTRMEHWNISELSGMELDALAGSIIELVDYYRENRRQIFGKVGQRHG